MSNRRATGIYERSVSLSVSLMAKSAPASPASDKKYVHFAEGEDLVNVKTYVPSYDDLDALRKVFLKELPLKTGKVDTIENSPSDVEESNESGRSKGKFAQLKGSSTKLTRRFQIVRTLSRDCDRLSALYDQLKPDELETLLTKNNICLSDTKFNGRTVSGLIIVNNLAYHKSVVVRHTFDSWETVLNVPAYYVSSSDEGKRDIFGFNLVFPIDRMELLFALQYIVNGREFWDNNYGNNYKIVDFS